MKKVKITLREFIRLGGKIENLNAPEEVTTTYGDANSLLTVSNISLTGTNTHNEPLYMVTYVGGTSHRYSGTWIQVEIDMKLEDKYLL
jgi:hypothetical protein